MATKHTTKRLEPEIVLSIRVTREQHARLKALASRENRSISQQVRHLIAQVTTPTDEPIAA